MLQITQRRQEGTLIAVYTGELDHHATRAAIEQTEDLLVLFPCDKLVLDLSELTFMDSSGLGLIMGRYELMRELGGDVTVRDPAPCVDRMLRLTGFDRRVKIELSTSGIRTPHGKR